MKRSHSVRLALLVLATLLLTGPAPGDAGGCGEAPDFVSAAVYCEFQQRLLLARARFRGEIDEEEEEMCALRAIAETCEPAGGVDGWYAVGCSRPPTEREAVACLEELELQKNAFVPIEQIPECVLCPPPAPPPAEPECP